MRVKHSRHYKMYIYKEYTYALPSNRSSPGAEVYKPAQFLLTQNVIQTTVYTFLFSSYNLFRCLVHAVLKIKSAFKFLKEFLFVEIK